MIIPELLDVCNKVVVPKTKVELHNHLDGSIRLDTIWDLMNRKGMALPGNGSYTALCDALTVKKPANLARFLAGFDIMYPAIKGDLEAIRRVCLEFCEDKANEGVAYVEPRISPHLMASDRVGTGPVLETLVNGLREGESRYGVKVRGIITCIRGMPEWSSEVVAMADLKRHEGIVGIDIAGNEQACVVDQKMTIHEEDIKAYTKAKELGIRRTAHAGEDGPADSVRMALDQLHAERIGHGYHVLDDEMLYQRCLKDQVHFEVCPASSLMTGSMSLGRVVDLDMGGHPVVRFASDNANFSLSCDDSFITRTSLSDEYKLAQAWGLTEAHIIQANFNAARSCFLPDGEKQILLKELRQAYRVDID